MATQRERLRERGQTQVSVWLPLPVAEALKTLSEQRNLSATKIISAAILAYADMAMLEQYPHSASTPANTNALEHLAEEIDSLKSRVLALETAQNAVSGASTGEQLSTPNLDAETPQNAVPVAVVASGCAPDTEAAEPAEPGSDLPAHIVALLDRKELQGDSNLWKRVSIELSARFSTGSPIAKILEGRGIRNSKGNPFQPADVDRILKSYNLK